MVHNKIHLITSGWPHAQYSLTSAESWSKTSFVSQGQIWLLFMIMSLIHMSDNRRNCLHGHYNGRFMSMGHSYLHPFLRFSGTAGEVWNRFLVCVRWRTYFNCYYIWVATNATFCKLWSFTCQAILILGQPRIKMCDFGWDEYIGIKTGRLWYSGSALDY